MTNAQFSEIINIMLNQDCGMKTACELLGLDNKILEQAAERYIKEVAA